MKKRFMLTLSQEPYDEMQKIVKEMGLPQNTISLICDDAIAGVLKVFKQAIAKGKFTITDLFTMMGEVVQNVTEEEKKNEALAITGGSTHKKQERTKKTAK